VTDAGNVLGRIVQCLGRAHQRIECRRHSLLFGRQHCLVDEQALQLDGNRDADLHAVVLMDLQYVWKEISEVPVRRGCVRVDESVERSIPAGARKRRRIPGWQSEEPIDCAGIRTQRERQLLAELILVQDLPADLDPSVPCPCAHWVHGWIDTMKRSCVPL
jgi:hypothetical protein